MKGVKAIMKRTMRIRKVFDALIVVARRTRKQSTAMVCLSGFRGGILVSEIDFKRWQSFMRGLDCAVHFQAYVGYWKVTRGHK